MFISAFSENIMIFLTSCFQSYFFKISRVPHDHVFVNQKTFFFAVIKGNNMIEKYACITHLRIYVYKFKELVLISALLLASH